MDAGLLQSAMKRAEELSLLFSHTRPDGTSCFSVNQDMVAEARKDTDDEEEKPDSVPAQKNKKRLKTLILQGFQSFSYICILQKMPQTGIEPVRVSLPTGF